MPLNIVVVNRGGGGSGVLEVKTFEKHWYKSNYLLLLFSYLISYSLHLKQDVLHLVKLMMVINTSGNALAI